MASEEELYEDEVVDVVSDQIQSLPLATREVFTSMKKTLEEQATRLDSLVAELARVKSTKTQGESLFTFVDESSSLASSSSSAPLGLTRALPFAWETAFNRSPLSTKEGLISAFPEEALVSANYESRSYYWVANGTPYTRMLPGAWSTLLLNRDARSLVSTGASSASSARCAQLDFASQSTNVRPGAECVRVNQDSSNRR